MRQTIDALSWHPFDPTRGDRQELPQDSRYVLCLMQPSPGYPSAVVVGSMKRAAGDKHSPYFVTPGAVIEKISHFPDRVLAWCDCLPDNFKYPSTETEGA